MVAQGQLSLLQRWLAEGKLQPSEEFADVLRAAEGRAGPAAALPLYRSAGLHDKEVLCLAEMLDVDEACEACLERQPKAYSTTITRPNGAAAAVPDWAALLAAACDLAPPRALALYEKLCALPPPPPPPDPEDRLAVMQACIGAPPPPPAPPTADAVALFLDHGGLEQGTKLALDGAAALPAALQTRVLVDNLSANAAIGEAMLEAAAFSSYDARAVGVRAEELGRYEQALRLLTAVDDVGRVLCADGVAVDACAKKVGEIDAADGLAVVQRLLGAGSSRCSRKALAAAQAHHAALGHPALLAAFTAAGGEAPLAYLSARFARTRDDPALTLEYLRACKAAGRVDELERVTRDPSVAFDGPAVLALLREAGGADEKDPRALLNLCERDGALIAGVVGVLHGRGMRGHLALYVQKINAENAPQVAAALLALGVDAAAVAKMAEPIGKEAIGKDMTLPLRLVVAFEERDQLAALKPWLDARKAEGLSRDVGGAVDDFPYAANIRDALDRIEVAAAKPKGWFK